MRIKVIVLEGSAVTSLKRQTFGTPDKGNFISLSLPLLIDIAAFREIVLVIAMVDYGWDSQSFPLLFELAPQS